MANPYGKLACMIVSGHDPIHQKNANVQNTEYLKRMIFESQRLTPDSSNLLYFRPQVTNKTLDVVSEKKNNLTGWWFQPFEKC